MLGRLTTHELAVDLLTGRGDAAHDRGDHPRLQLAHGQVVEEPDRTGAVTDHVVRAHRHEVAPDGVVAVQEAGDLRLRAHAVGGRHEDRLAISSRKWQRGAETAQRPQEVAAPAEQSTQRLHDRARRVHVHAGRRVRGHRGSQPFAQLPASTGIGRSRTNLWELAS